MLLPASGPKSNCTALNLKFSEENWLRTPWADSRTGAATDTRTMSTNNRSMTLGVVHGLKPGRPLTLVESLKDRKSTRLNSSHDQISYAVFCLKKKKTKYTIIFNAVTI